MTLQPGSRPVPGYPDYVLIGKLGAGAFGEVWHAHGPGGIDIALKFIRLNSCSSEVELRSLEVMKNIRHPNLVSLFGAWQRDNWLILAMELCDGTLQDRLVEALDQNLPGIPADELLSHMSDAANGLDALNARQVQHRDVKPANLLLLDSGVKVADFGLAKALEETMASNSGAGTIAYLAPECFRGILTQQSDQYSLAVTYYHLRTGRPLFEGNQAQMMYAHLELEPNLSLLPPAERFVLSRALSKEPSKRWRNCAVFVSELVKAYGQAKAEERDSQEAYRRRQEQELQEQYEGQGHAGTTPGRRELCWFCKKNEADGRPDSVQLAFRKASTKTIDVPRCTQCQRQWVLLGWAPIVVSLAFLGVGVLCLVLKGNLGPHNADVLETIGMGSCITGGICTTLFTYGWSLILLWWQHKAVAEHPSIKPHLDSGWQLAAEE